GPILLPPGGPQVVTTQGSLPTPVLTPLPGEPGAGRVIRGGRGFGFAFEGPRSVVESFAGRIASLLLLLAAGIGALYLTPARLARSAAALDGGANMVRLGLVGLAGHIIV